MPDVADVTQSILDAWDDEEPQSGIAEHEQPATPEPAVVPPEPEPVEDPEEPGRDDEPREEQEAEEGGEDDGEAEGDGEEPIPGVGFDTDDPEVLAFLAKYGGDPQKALKGAADLARVFGRQGSDLAALRQREAMLQQMVQEAQALNGSQPLSDEQRAWAEQAANSGNPTSYIRQAIGEGEYDLARAVCREWATDNPFEAGRAGQYIDQVEVQAFQEANQPAQASTDQVMEALGSAMPEMQAWWGQMAQVSRHLGVSHPLVQEARSPDPDTAMRGMIGLYEIARASTASVSGAKEKIKKEGREAADGARANAAVSSASTSPKPSQIPPHTRLMPGLTLEDLDTEFARP